MNNEEKFITQILLHGFKGFRNMEFWEIEFFLNQHKWVKAPVKENIKKTDITIEQEKEKNED